MNYKENLQLAKTTLMSKVVFPTRAERKMDGVRLYMLDGTFHTRSGKVVNLPKTKAMIHNARGLFVDMEVTLESGKLADRPTISGMINSAMKGGTIDESKLHFNVFDIMPSDLYRTKTPLEIYRQRLFSVDAFVVMNKHVNFRLVPHWAVKDAKELDVLYNEQLDAGYEGLVTKCLTDLYSFKRSKHWARFKATKTADLLCIAVTPGQGKYEGMIGALMVEGIVEDTFVTVKAGSGMSDQDRSLDPSEYVGKTVEIKYNSVTQDKTTELYSLFQPRFITVRGDKS